MKGFEYGFDFSWLAHHGVKGMKWRKRRIRKARAKAPVPQTEASKYAEACGAVLEREGDTRYEDLRIEKSVRLQVQQLTEAEKAGSGATRTKKLFSNVR